MTIPQLAIIYNEVWIWTPTSKIVKTSTEKKGSLVKN